MPSFTTDPNPSPTAKTSASNPPASGSDRLNELVAEMLREQQVNAARSAFAREHLPELPEAYRRMLPETDDVALLAAAGQQQRQQFRHDVRTFLKAREIPLLHHALEDDDDALFSRAD